MNSDDERLLAKHRAALRRNPLVEEMHPHELVGSKIYEMPSIHMMESFKSTIKNNNDSDIASKTAPLSCGITGNSTSRTIGSDDDPSWYISSVDGLNSSQTTASGGEKSTSKIDEQVQMKKAKT